MKRFRLNKRGVSNVIVVMLSLVLIVIVVSNVILWSHQMNQLDWEKIQEKITLASAERITSSKWFTCRNEYVTSIGTRTSGLYTNTWAINGTYEAFRESSVPLAYDPSAYALGGSTRFLSGTPTDLTTNDDAYMSFRSYSSAFNARSLYTHQETTIVEGTPYSQLGPGSSDAAGQNLSVPVSTAERKLWGRFVYPLTGNTGVPTSTWTICYRAYKAGILPVVHCDVDILIRRADGTVRATVATDVANSASLSNSWSTVSATYLWNSYAVVDAGDFLEVDFYAHVTTVESSRIAYLRIDDSALATDLQTRIDGIMLPSAYTIEIELSGTSNTQNWESLIWTVDDALTTNTVNVTLQLYDFNASTYPSSGNGYISYVSNSTPDIDETRNQTITTSPQHFRNPTGGWRLRMTGIKATNSQFDMRIDWVQFQVVSLDSYRLDVSGDFQLDVSTYPRLYVKSVEILLRYRASDSIENWFLKAYNWTKGQYDNTGFNTTAGNTPTSEFGYYSVNLTDRWRSYVQTDGTIRLEFCDLTPDSNQTAIDIDFLGARAAIDGVKLTVKNEGSLTCHLVAVWTVNQTRHERHSANFFINSGTNAEYVRADVTLPIGDSLVKVVTERGNIAVLRRG